MNAITNLLDYLEARTKVASLIPFLVGTGFAMYRYGSIRPQQTLVFFAAMLLFDLTTTAINNHIDSRHTGGVPHYSNKVSLAIIFAMGLTASGLGIYLASITSVVILIAGVLCFAAGISYSFGLIPISRTPFGELVAGIMMGIFIPFIAVEISHPMIAIAFQDFSRVVVTVDWVELLYLVIVAVPVGCTLSSITFANNICDCEEDARIQRYTLPVCIGMKKSLVLYRLLYITAYVFVGIGIALRIVPIFTLVLILTCAPVRKNIQRFVKLQDKKQTFVTSIHNFLIITILYAACIWSGSLILSIR